MTYEEIVEKVRECFENADAREIFEHIAIQVNIVGEGSGAFYIEIAQRYASVEPYDYYDRDVLVTTDGETLFALLEQRLSIGEAMEAGRLSIQGNQEKIHLFSKIKFDKSGK